MPAGQPAGRWRYICQSTIALQTYGLLALAFATGFFGLAAEVVLLYTFQNACGYAYAEVGLIVAIFMVGLALGAWAGVRWERRRAALTWVALAAAAYCAALPLAVAELSARAGLGGLLGPAFQALVLAAGFLDGAAFPLVVAAMGRLGFARPGPWAYAADLAGSGLGALVTGALLVPLLGTGAALALVAITLAAALGAAMAGGRRPDALPVCSSAFRR